MPASVSWCARPSSYYFALSFLITWLIWCGCHVLYSYRRNIQTYIRRKKTVHTSSDVLLLLLLWWLLLLVSSRGPLAGNWHSIIIMKTRTRNIYGQSCSTNSAMCFRVRRSWRPKLGWVGFCGTLISHDNYAAFATGYAPAWIGLGRSFVPQWHDDV